MTILKPMTEREKQEFRKAHDVEAGIARITVYCIQHECEDCIISKFCKKRFISSPNSWKFNKIFNK